MADFWTPSQPPAGGVAYPTGATPPPPPPPGYSFDQVGGQYPLAGVTGPGLMQPFSAGFSAPGGAPSGFSAPAGGSDDPGFNFAMAEGQKGVQRSAASKGSLLTGGTLKDLTDYTTGMALRGYADHYNRRFGEYRASAEDYNNAYNRSWGEYMGAANIYNQNTGRQYDMMSGYAGAGLNAAGEYANIASNNLTGAGNARAAGQAASGNAWSAAATNIGDIAAGAISNYPYSRTPSTGSGGGAASGYTPATIAPAKPGTIAGQKVTFATGR